MFVGMQVVCGWNKRLFSESTHSIDVKALQVDPLNCGTCGVYEVVTNYFWTPWRDDTKPFFYFEIQSSTVILPGVFWLKMRQSSRKAWKAWSKLVFCSRLWCKHNCRASGTTPALPWHVFRTLVNVHPSDTLPSGQPADCGMSVWPQRGFGQSHLSELWLAEVLTLSVCESAAAVHAPPVCPGDNQGLPATTETKATGQECLSRPESWMPKRTHASQRYICRYKDFAQLLSDNILARKFTATFKRFLNSHGCIKTHLLSFLCKKNK